MAKYQPTELGHVAKDFISRHTMTYVELGKAVTEATGFEVKEPSFQDARRNERALEPLRKHIMDYMRERDPALVQASLATYEAIYGQKGA